MKTKQHILVVSLSNIGDVVLTTPVIMNLALRFPNAHMTVITGPKALSLLEGSRYIHRLVVYDKKAPWLDKLRFVASLWRFHYDYVVDLRNTAIPFLVSAAKRSHLFRSYEKGGMRRRHLNVLTSMGLVVDEGVEPFDFYHARETESAVRHLYGQEPRGVLIAAGSASELKRWPLERFQQVIQYLLEHTEFPVYLIGDVSEKPYVDPLCAFDPGRVMNLAGALTLRETAALIAKSALLITNDSAAMHLGHEMRKNVVALFGPSDPEKYGREGGTFRIIRGQKADERNYFAGAEAADVIAACVELLDGAKV